MLEVNLSVLQPYYCRNVEIVAEMHRVSSIGHEHEHESR